MFKSLKINLIILSVAGLILVGAFNIFLSMSDVKAQTTLTYGVYLDNATGMFSGWAWSDNIGWIKFGGLSGFPSGIGTVSQNVQLDSSNKIIGWARACAGTVTGDCSSMESRNDGWDGWISLSGTGYGVVLNGTDLSGYAWGSDVIGWMDFTGVKLSPAPINAVTTDYLWATPASVLKNSSTTISWSSTGADSCEITKKEGTALPVVFSTATSSSKLSGLLNSNTVFTLDCKNSVSLANKILLVSVNDVPIPPKPPVKPGTPSGPDSSACVGTECDIVWNDICTVEEDINYSGDYILNCVDPAIPEATTTIRVPERKKSYCTASQANSPEMYVGANTTWKLTNNGTDITLGRVKWSGTNIATTTISTAGQQLDKIYTTVGKKAITGVTIITNNINNSTFISACSASTTMRQSEGSITNQ